MTGSHGPRQRTALPSGRTLGTGGFTLIELLVGSLLTFLCLSAAWRVVSHHRRAAMVAMEFTEGLEVVRTTAWLLGEELYSARAGIDFHGAPGDSLIVRAFRGLGLPAAFDSLTGWLAVCYRGLREVDTAKDSALVLDPDGIWRSVALVGRSEDEPGCLGVTEGRMERWRTDPPFVVAPVLVRVFESGVYFFRDGAFRYRRGFGGRQPLTPERVEDGTFLPETPGGGRVGWALRLGGTEGVLTGQRWEGAVW